MLREPEATEEDPVAEEAEEIFHEPEDPADEPVDVQALQKDSDMEADVEGPLEVAGHHRHDEGCEAA